MVHWSVICCAIPVYIVFKGWPEISQHATRVRQLCFLVVLGVFLYDTPIACLLALVGFFGYHILGEIFERLVYTRDSKRMGCESPKIWVFRPFGIPLLSKIRRLTEENRQLDFFTDILHESGCKTVRFLTLNTLVIMTYEPENVKTMLATKFKDYSLGIRYEQFYPLLGNGIFTLSGDGWKHSRTMLRPQFARSQVSQLDSIHRHVVTLIRLCQSKSSTGSGLFDIQDLFHRLTIDTATEFLFGDSVDSLRDSQVKIQGPTMAVSCAQFAVDFTACLDMLSHRSQLGPLYWCADSFTFRHQVKVCHNFVDHFVYRALARASASENQEKQDNQSSDAPYVFIEELALATKDPVVIRDQAFNILLAGRDTTAGLLSFILYHLSRNKRVWTKLRSEVVSHFGPTFDLERTTASSQMTFESLKRCQYLTHVINETLRLHPSVPVNMRSAIRDTVLPTGGGVDGTKPVLVKKGMRVVYSPHVMHRLPEYWGADAAEFRPERWEGTLHGWEYLPFNGGPRICLGQQYALTETSFTIVALLLTFTEIQSDGRDPLCQDVRQRVQLTTNVANGVWVKCI